MVADRKSPLGMICRRKAGCLAAVLAAFALACSSGIPPHPEPEPGVEGFSSRLAKAHFDGLGGLYPRLPGSSGDGRARRYLEREFRLSGARVSELAASDGVHLVAELSGHSEDSILLVAPLPTLAAADWVDDSGAALLVEVARVFAAEKPPYSLRFALADTRPMPLVFEEASAARKAVAAEESEVRWGSIDNGEVARERLVLAGQSLVAQMGGMAGWEGLEGLRAIVTVDFRARVDPRFVRDLRSHPIFRKVFWQSASSLGFVAEFPMNGLWGSPQGLHLAFIDPAMGRVLALVDEGARVASPPRVGEEGVAPEAFEAVGQVTVEGLTRLMQRFEKIDAFRE